MANIHQLIAGASVGDAITNYTFEIQKIYTDLNCKSYIFAPLQHTAKEYKGIEVKDQNELDHFLKGDDILLYHYSIGSTSTEIYKKFKGKKAICYHNITPKKYFASMSKKQSDVLEEGRKKLKELIDITDIALAVSNYNAGELKDVGFKNVHVVPLVFPTDYLKTNPNKSLLNTFKNNTTNFLFVGRVVPNKKFEDLIKIFNYYTNVINSNSKLFLVGTYVGNEKYYTFLKSMVFDLQLTNKVIFSGHVTQKDLITYYNIASLFLCVSHHEGFGLPLIESMYFNIPVFALNKAAISETLGDSGILIQKMNYKYIAELIDYILNEKKLLNKIIKNQKKRLEYYNIKNLQKKLVYIFEKYNI